MEMESIQPDHDVNFVKISTFEQLVPPSSHTLDGLCGTPEVHSRVGEQYQAEIPPMISEADRLQLLTDPLDAGNVVNVSHIFLLGLPMPVMLLHDTKHESENEGSGCLPKSDDAVDKNGSKRSRKSKKNCVSKKECSILNAESLDDQKESNAANLTAKVAEKFSLDQLAKSKNCYLVPGSKNGLWNEAEVDSFILGLYIFGKNFVQIKSFIDKKEMGEILAFYYGEFYRSDNYRRWSDSRKPKRKKCVYGKKIFTGWRQQELFSRLQTHVPEHFRTTFEEVSRAFTEENITLEEYVSNLKAAVGIQILVEAVGIGKGKDDLTSLAVEPAKSNLFPACPIGKNCSSLTSNDIIRLLTGGFRLSKARCNDIFWEAVWPRLLARGWHSEQPKNQGFADSKHCLVFLVPGVEKFSRSKLEKGNHYYDSVSDVLSKVASEPKLLELEAEETRDSRCNDDIGLVSGTSADRDSPYTQKSNRYLKPRVSTHNVNLVKFTVIDSSLGWSGKLSKVTEMRYSPDYLNVSSLFTSLSSSIERIFLENSSDKNGSDTANVSLDSEKNVSIADSNEGESDDSGSIHTKLTIVDTSAIDLGTPSMVREQSFSTLCFKASSVITNQSREKAGDHSKDAPQKHVPKMAANLLSNGEKNANKSNCSKGKFDSTASDQKGPNSDSRNKLVESVQDWGNVSNEDQLPRTVKHQFSRRAKSGPRHSENFILPVKRRRLTACSGAEMSHAIKKLSVGPGSNELGPSCALNSPKAGSHPSQEKFSSSSLLQGSPELKSSGGTTIAVCSGIEGSQGENVEHKSPFLIDLNVPQVTLESEDGNNRPQLEVKKEAPSANITCSSSDAEKPDPEALGSSTSANPAEEQLDTDLRRKSTRNRPLSTRALEALECNLLNGRKRQRSTQEVPLRNSSRRDRSKVKARSSSVGTGTTDGTERRDANEALNNEMDSIVETPDKREEL